MVSSCLPPHGGPVRLCRVRAKNGAKVQPRSPDPSPKGLLMLSGLLEPGRASRAASSAPPGVGNSCSVPASQLPTSQCYKARGPGWVSQGSPMCLPHCPPPFCTLPVHTPHVAQVGIENKVYLHSDRQGMLSGAGLGVKGLQTTSGPQLVVQQSIGREADRPCLWEHHREVEVIAGQQGVQRGAQAGVQHEEGRAHAGSM